MRILSLLPALGLGSFEMGSSTCGIQTQQGMFAICSQGEEHNLQSATDIDKVDAFCWETTTHPLLTDVSQSYGKRRRRASDVFLSRVRRSAGGCNSFKSSAYASNSCKRMMCKNGKRNKCLACAACKGRGDTHNFCSTVCSRLGEFTWVKNINTLSHYNYLLTHDAMAPRRTCYNQAKVGGKLWLPEDCLIDNVPSRFRDNTYGQMPILLNTQETANVRIENYYDTVIVVINVQLTQVDFDSWVRLREMAKTALVMFDESFGGDFFVIFEGRDELAKIYGSHPDCASLSGLREALAIVDEEMMNNQAVSLDLWELLGVSDSQWGHSFQSIMDSMGKLLNKGNTVSVQGNVGIVHFQAAGEASITTGVTQTALNKYANFRLAHPEITNLRIAFNYIDDAAPQKFKLKQVIESSAMENTMTQLVFEDAWGHQVTAGGIIDTDILVLGYQSVGQVNLANYFSIMQEFFDNWESGEDIGDITDDDREDAHICESNNPCQNGCTCAPSCRDHLDYVCTPLPGLPFVGKNCEWPVNAVCGADNRIHVDIPEEAIAAYELNVDNGILHGCNRADFMCDESNRQCGPVSQGDFNGQFSLDCFSSSMQSVNGVFSFSQTFVIDRDSALIHMPIPVVTVSCRMSTGSAAALLDPQMRGPQTKDYQLVWTPQVRFYKTPFDVVPGVEANNGEVISNNGVPEVGYVVGEKLHVRVTGVLDNVVPSTPFQVRVDSCHISQVNENGSPVSGSRVSLIVNGVATSNQVPVGVEVNPGLISAGAAGNQGAGFWFQMFTFRAGSKLQMFCTATFSPHNNGRKRRSVDEDEHHEFSLNIRVFDDGANVDPDVPVIVVNTEEPEDSIEYEAPTGRFAPITEDDYDINDTVIEEIKEIQVSVETTFLLKALLLCTFICLTMLIGYQVFIHRRSSAIVYTTDRCDEKMMMQ